MDNLVNAGYAKREPEISDDRAIPASYRLTVLGQKWVDAKKTAKVDVTPEVLATVLLLVGENGILSVLSTRRRFRNLSLELEVLALENGGELSCLHSVIFSYRPRKLLQ